jgi:hypothetical protein
MELLLAEPFAKELIEGEVLQALGELHKIPCVWISRCFLELSSLHRISALMYREQGLEHPACRAGRRDKFLHAPCPHCFGIVRGQLLRILGGEERHAVTCGAWAIELGEGEAALKRLNLIANGLF